MEQVLRAILALNTGTTQARSVSIPGRYQLFVHLLHKSAALHVLPRHPNLAAFSPLFLVRHLANFSPKDNGFKGFCSVFVVAAFAFGGTELVGLAAAEAENPRKSIPQATKQVFWRISFFYIVSLFVLGLIVPFNDPNLLNATSGADSRYSPFVIAIRLAGIKVNSK